MERPYITLWKQYLTEAEQMTVTPDQINTLMTTKSEDGVRAMFKQGMCTYTDDAGNSVTLDLTAVPGARGIAMQGNVNVDVNSALYGYLKDYVITLTPRPDNSGLINDGARLENIVNNDSNKFVQFVNPAAEDETILFIRTKSGKVQMLYLNAIERSKK